jgi:PPOX class probable F420-dependent enzyme
MPSAVEIDQKALELLGQALIGNLGFIGLDGNPHVIPVWFTFTGEEVLVASPPDAYKCRALRADPRAVLTVSTHSAPYHVVSISGKVRVDVIEEAERIAFVREVAVRYLGDEGGQRYIDGWIKGGHPGPGDLIRLPAGKVRYTRV